MLTSDANKWDLSLFWQFFPWCLYSKQPWNVEIISLREQREIFDFYHSVFKVILVDVWFLYCKIFPFIYIQFYEFRHVTIISIKIQTTLLFHQKLLSWPFETIFFNPVPVPRKHCSTFFCFNFVFPKYKIDSDYNLV
jgi:hypothetical protein